MMRDTIPDSIKIVDCGLISNSNLAYIVFDYIFKITERVALLGCAMMYLKQFYRLNVTSNVLVVSGNNNEKYKVLMSYARK